MYEEIVARARILNLITRGGRLESALRGGIFTWRCFGETRDVDDLPLCAAGPTDRVEVRRQYRDLLHLGIRRAARGLAAALCQRQEAAMGCRRTDRLVARPRSREPDDARRPGRPHLRHGHLEPDEREGAAPGSPSPASLADIPIHAWRAGRADRH